MGAASGRRRAEPGARRPSEPPGPLRRKRHPRDRRQRDHTRPLGHLGGSRRGPAARFGRSRHVARRALSHDSRRSTYRRRSLLRLRRQPHRLSRHRVLAARRSVARMAVLRIGRVQFAQSMVEGLSCVERLRDARSVLSPGRNAGSGRAALLSFLRVTGDAWKRGPAEALRQCEPSGGRHHVRTGERPAPAARVLVRLHLGPAAPEREGRRGPADHSWRRLGTRLS